MRILVLSILMLFSAQATLAQSVNLEAEVPVNLGHGVFLEVIPPVFESIARKPPEPVEGWVVIPATFETINETVVIQEAYTELKVIPAILAEDGSRLEPAQASLVDIPAVTKTVTRRVVKTPQRVEKRIIPVPYSVRVDRKKVSEAVYVFRDAAGEEISRYDDPLFAMRFIESLPN